MMMMMMMMTRPRPLLLLALLCVAWLRPLPLATALEEDAPLDLDSRKTVPYHSANGHLFREDGVTNYSTMLLREDLGLLLVGAREAVYALDLSDISNKKAEVSWEVTSQQQEDCQNKGKNPQVDCKNYIRTLHTMEDGRMYVCGTNAFDPACRYMSYADGTLALEDKEEDGKGKCPFDPFQRYSSIMVGDDLYSATSMNFLGSEPVVMRSSAASVVSSVRTDFKSSWLNEPTFISMSQMPESDASEAGDDDKVYLFFSETAVEYDFYNKLLVSRVARVCKGDLGGQRTLQKKWTSFLKARLDCPVLESQLPYIIQDTFLWCDPLRNWKHCMFYAVFTPQSDSSGLSAVCAYNVLDISKVFSEGKYKTPVTVETSFVKWVMYSKDVPSPRPGACIDAEARKQGINRTLDLPDRTLQFIRDRPLMDQAVQPIGEKPLLVRRGATFTRIIVDQVQAADQDQYHVMFIGTERGTVVKAVNFADEMFIVEEVKLFQTDEPIKVLRFSDATGHLYAGSELGVVQMPLASCGRSASCVDCVLARDPYCGWDKTTAQCVALSDSQSSELLQSVKQGNASVCPESDPAEPLDWSVWHDGNAKLRCVPPSNLAVTRWQRADLGPLTPSGRLQFLRDGLLVLNATAADQGLYRCLSEERSSAGRYTTTVAQYRLLVTAGGDGRSGLLPQARTDGPSVVGLQAAVGLLVVLLAALLAWNFYKGHVPLPWSRRGGGGEDDQVTAGDHQGGAARRQEPEGQQQGALVGSAAAAPESKPLMTASGGAEENCSSSNNNHSTTGGGGEALQFIDEESQI